jgi:hypothetical protein
MVFDRVPWLQSASTTLTPDLEWAPGHRLLRLEGNDQKCEKRRLWKLNLLPGCAFAHEGLQCCLDFVALSVADAAFLLRRCVNEWKIEGSAKANNRFYCSMEPMRMSHAVAVQFPLPKSNFCGEREPDNHGAPLGQSRGLRRQRADPGPGWVSSLSGAAAIGAAGPSITILPSSVDTPELSTYPGARLSCARRMEVVGPREQIGRQSKYENTLLRVQPSIVNLGGSVVS